MRRRDARREGCRESEQDVAVAGEDAACHCAYQDVDSAREKFFVGFFGRGEGGDGGGEGVFGGHEF